MSFDLSDYVDVAERVRLFLEKYPEGSLQSSVTFLHGELINVSSAGNSDFVANGPVTGVLCKALAYRSPSDERPGVGHAFEPIPGKTPYTKDSEVMNAETSAWGRAIVACGISSKKIASADEVRNRQGNGNSSPADDLTTPPEDAKPSEYVIHFGKNRGVLLGALTAAQLAWYATKWEVQDTPSDYDLRLKAAAAALNSGSDEPLAADPYPEVPFV